MVYYEVMRHMDLKVFKLNKDRSPLQNEFLFLISGPFPSSSKNEIVPTPYSFGFDSQCLSSRASIVELYVQAAQSTLQFKALENVRQLAASAADYFSDNFELDHSRNPNLPRVVIVVAVYCCCGFPETEMCTAIANAPRLRIAEGPIGPLLTRLRGLSGTGWLISRVPPLNAFQRGAWTGCCAICLEDFTPEMDHARKMPCNHIFHGRCLARWVWVNTSCPLCRSPPFISSRRIC